MTRTLLLLFVALITTVGSALADEERLIAATCIADGIEYDCNRPIFTETGFTFKTIDPDIKGSWELYQTHSRIYVNDESFLTASENGENYSSFFFDINNVDWSRFRRDYFYYPAEEYNERGYYIYVKFTAEDGRTDTRVFMYAVPTVLPSKPVVTNAYFEIENYNYEEDSMWDGCDPQSCFIVDVYSEHATKFFLYIYFPGSAGHYFTVDDWKNESWHSASITGDEIIEVTNGHGSYRYGGAEWDDLIVFQAVNGDGHSYESEPVLLGDYITDPAIRARIDELQIEAGMDGIVASDSLTIGRDGNVVTAASDSKASVMLEIVGVDGAKRAVVTGRGQAVADLSSLAPGVYVVRASDGSNVKTIKIMIQGGNR